MTLCGWCRCELASTAKSTALYCGRKCRQLAWLARRRSMMDESDSRRKRIAYADPPFPGMAARYYRDQPSYAGEVDHVALVSKLQAFDGWALSTSHKSLRWWLFDLIGLEPGDEFHDLFPGTGIAGRVFRLLSSGDSRPGTASTAPGVDGAGGRPMMSTRASIDGRGPE